MKDKILNIGDLVYIKNTSNTNDINRFGLVTLADADSYAVSYVGDYKRDDLLLIKRNHNVDLMYSLSDVNESLRK